MGKTSEQKKQAKKYILGAFGALTVLALAVMPMLAAGNSGEDTAASILSASAERKNIDKQLIGGGQLSSDACLNVRIPENVKLTAYLVGNGDVVSEGDAIANVDKVSVMTAITQVQETLDYLSGKIASASAQEAPTAVTALAGGTVKAVYAQKGDSVQDVMLEHGALAVLSLDGKMEVKVSCESDLKSGGSVTVTFDNGDTAEGTVRSNLEGVLTVSLDDEGYDIGEEVSVTTEDGKKLGTGELYLSSPWNATAYSGSVSSVWINEGNTVSIGQTLFSLEDTGATAEYQQLIDQRQKYEELMQELFQMYRTETITAPCDGIVTGVDSDAAFLLNGEGDSWFATLLSIFGNGTSNPEADYQLVLLSDVEYLNEECNGEADCPAQTHDPGCKALCDGTKDCTAINHKAGCLSQMPEDPPMLTVSIVTPALSDGLVGQSYTAALQASDGTELLSGSWGASGLPEGLQLDADSGVISGTPAAEGSFPVTVSFTYGGSTVTKDYTLTVSTPQATAVYRGYVAQIVEISEGNLKVMRTSYSYTITDLNHLPVITTVDQKALTEEAFYPAGENLSVNDYVLIILDSDGALMKIVKQDITPGAGQSGGAAPDAGHGGQGGGTSSPGGGMAGGGTGQAQTFTLYSLDKVTVASVTSQEHMGVSISIDELDITNIFIGQEATVCVDALGGEQFDATVTGIANSGSNSGGNSKFAVELTLEKSGEMLPGMYCSALITLDTAENVLCIPVAALGEDGDDTIVYTEYDEENGLRNPVTVTVGVSDGENAEILSGLNQGETCYYSYYDTYVRSDSRKQSTSFNLMGIAGAKVDR